jgi:hypothetical protein
VEQGEEQDASLIAPLTRGPSEVLKLYRDQSRGTRVVRTRVLRAFSVARISLLPQCTLLGFKRVFNTARTSLGYGRVHEVGYVPHEVLDYNLAAAGSPWERDWVPRFAESCSLICR